MASPRENPELPTADMSAGLLPGEPRRALRVFPDYTEWPLWESSTDWRDSPYTMEPSDYGLSADVTALLRAWQDVWDRHFRHDSGWDSPEHDAEWTRLGDRTVSRLRDEVGAWADVEYDGKPY